jgi:predicted anti-sigma-YlaC factor YlaD
MENRFEPTRLAEWLHSIATTEEDEVDCDELTAAAERLVAAGTRGDDLRAVLPGLAVHLDHCPDCRDWYETLLGFSREEESSTEESD